MKYRVRLDLSFDKEEDALTLMEIAKKVAPNATNINVGKPNAEVGFVDYELCGHDEGAGCKKLERIDV